MEREVILTRLLDKYENSKHLMQPGASNRRVMLQTDKKDLPEYDWERAAVRDQYNLAAQELERKGLVTLEWNKGLPIFKKVILNLDQVERAYQEIGSRHPRRAAEEAYDAIWGALPAVQTPWIAAWRDDVCRELREKWKLPGVCTKGEEYLRDFLRVLTYYDGMGETYTTVRSLSSKCFHNSKRFEGKLEKDFLRTAEQYEPELHALCLQEKLSGQDKQGDKDKLSDRDKLMFLGIYPHPELYQMCGRCAIQMRDGVIDLAPLSQAGIGIPSTAVERVQSFRLEGIRRITFLENKTNYEEYLLTEQAPDELAVYHGGFLSPRKRMLLRKLADSLAEDVPVFFWADIDQGGFAMFERLQRIYPQLAPMRMGRREVEQYAEHGLKRPESYLEALREARNEGKFPLFHEAIDAILAHGVTIEQEAFLGQ